MTTGSSKNGATTLPCMNVLGYVGHTSVASWMPIVGYKCMLCSSSRYRARVGLHLVTGWLIVDSTYICTTFRRHRTGPQWNMTRGGLDCLAFPRWAGWQSCRTRSWTWTRVRFLEDLDLKHEDLDSKVKDLDLKGEDVELGLWITLQRGFRKQRSTTDHLVCLESFNREAFIQRQHAVAVFFDLEKAYDCTWKYGIMKDLHEAGLRGRLPCFIEGFL